MHEGGLDLKPRPAQVKQPKAEEAILEQEKMVTPPSQPDLHEENNPDMPGSTV